MTDTFRCGHPRSPENTYRRGDYARCRTCHREHQKTWKATRRQLSLAGSFDFVDRPHARARTRILFRELHDLSRKRALTPKESATLQHAMRSLGML